MEVYKFFALVFFRHTFVYSLMMELLLLIASARINYAFEKNDYIMFKYHALIKKNMTEKRKRHFKVGEVKSLLLEIVLANEGPIKESDVRILLKEKFESFDQSTINRHLRYLKERGCIEKIVYVNKSRSFWNVENFENIKNIRSEFKDVTLNSYEKAIRIVLRKNGYRVTDLGGFFTYIQLLLSDSFFNACLDTSIGLLTTRSITIYKFNNAGSWGYIGKKTVECSIDFIKRYPNIDISKEDFVHTLTKTSRGKNVTNSYEGFLEVWKENIRKFVKENLREIEDDHDIYNRMYDVVKMIQVLTEDFKDTLFLVLFESYFLQDVMLDKASDEEIDYAIGTKSNADEYTHALDLKKEKRESLVKLFFSDFEQAAIVMANHKQPSLFNKKVFENAEDINQSLRIYFKSDIRKFSE